MSVPGPYGDIRHPYGLPAGTVRGFMSVLICSFFWIALLVPEEQARQASAATLGHFVLFFLVFSSFVSHHPIADLKAPMLPWLMRVIFVGGSIAVLAYVLINHPGRIGERLTPDQEAMKSWPVLVGMMVAGFAAGLFVRFVLGKNGELFQTIRGWTGVIAMLLLIAELVFQFAIKPSLGAPPGTDTLKVWERIIVACVSGYFGTRS